MHPNECRQLLGQVECKWLGLHPFKSVKNMEILDFIKPFLLNIRFLYFYFICNSNIMNLNVNAVNQKEMNKLHIIIENVPEINP